MRDAGWELKLLELDGGRCPFEDWYRGIRHKQTRLRIAARLFRVQTGNMGDCKPLAQWVFELRLNFGPGYRIYFAQYGQTLVVLLAGGDKSTQQRDIEAAQGMWESSKNAIERFQRNFRG